MTEAHALWITGNGKASLKTHILTHKVGESRVKTHFSAISRGTESLVFHGNVPESQYHIMRAPFQEGDFPGPVKYGYSAVGQVIDGPDAGRSVFCLYPHQSHFSVPSESLCPIPPNIPLRRAILAPMMETALNGLWDAGAMPGLRYAVVGGGLIGMLVAFLLGKLPGADVTIHDVKQARESLATDFGCSFHNPSSIDTGSRTADCDVVFHCSSSEAGLSTSLALAGDQATVIELSWFGTKSPSVPLGEAFHSRRLRLISSQVGRVPVSLASRWTTRRRIAKALELLDDDRLDALLAPDIPFEQLPREMARLVDPAHDVLCQPVAYQTS